MTTRPTDEDIRSLIDGLRSPAYWFSGSSAGHEGENERPLQAAKMLAAWLAERQAARDGVPESDWIMKLRQELMMSKMTHSFQFTRDEVMEMLGMLNSTQPIAQPVASISDALNFLEEWALAGNKLHGDDIQQFHAIVERIAPVAHAEGGDGISDLRIVCAANRKVFTGEIVLGVRHWDAFMRHLDSEVDPIEQGFIDNKGNFHTRASAWTVASAAGQILRRVGGDDANGGTLYSENLY